MDKNYEAIVQVRDEDKKIVGALNSGLPIVFIADDEDDAKNWLNLEYAPDIKALREQGKVEYVIRPFLAS